MVFDDVIKNNKNLAVTAKNNVIFIFSQNKIWKLLNGGLSMGWEKIKWKKT